MGVELNTKYTRNLPVQLPAKVIAEKGLELEQQLSEIDMLEADMKAKADEFKSLITDRKKGLMVIRRAMQTGEEWREVECMDIANPAESVIETHRLDVGPRHPKRIVSRRPMDLFEAAQATEESQADGDAMAHAEETEKKSRKARAGKPAKEKKGLRVVKGNGKGNGKDHSGVTSKDWEAVGDGPLIVGDPNADMSISH